MSSRDPYTIRILLGANFLSNSHVQTIENTLTPLYIIAQMYL